MDNVDADADAPELGGSRSPVLLQHGRQADDGRQRWDHKCRRRHEWKRRDGGRQFWNGVRHKFAVQVHRHVRMIAVVDHQWLAVEQQQQQQRFRTFSLVAKLETAHTTAENFL